LPILRVKLPHHLPIVMLARHLFSSSTKILSIVVHNKLIVICFPHYTSGLNKMALIGILIENIKT